MRWFDPLMPIVRDAFRVNSLPQGFAPPSVGLFVMLLAACEGGPVESAETERPEVGLPSLQCAVSPDVVVSGGVGRDGIPALVNPELVEPTHPDAAYIEEYLAAIRDIPDAADARVVGLTQGARPVAIPLNILWWHEIVNLDLGGRRLAVTYCPLTGSALVFDATAAGTRRFGVSGLIFQNNLVMFDEETESLWPQLCRRATEGDKEGTQLVQVPAIEMRWQEWKARHPNTLVVSSQTGVDRDYARNPYQTYEAGDLLVFPHPGPIDTRRPLKEPVLGILADGGIALPFGALEATGARGVLRLPVGGGEVLILWDGDARAAAAYHPRTVDGTTVLLRAEGNTFVDVQTGSSWNIEGHAIAGPLAGSALDRYEDAYVAYWFAWTAFNPKTQLWTAE